MCRTVIKTVDQCMGIHYIDAMTKWASVPINISHLSNDMKPTKFNSSRYCCADFFQSICVAMEIAPNSIQLYHQVIHNKLKTYKHTQSVEVCVCVFISHVRLFIIIATMERFLMPRSSTMSERCTHWGIYYNIPNDLNASHKWDARILKSYSAFVYIRQNRTKFIPFFWLSILFLLHIIPHFAGVVYVL